MVFGYEIKSDRGIPFILLFNAPDAVTGNTIIFTVISSDSLFSFIYEESPE